LKTLLKGLLSLAAILAALAGVAAYLVFGRNLPIQDHGHPADGVETVKISIVSATLLDVAPGKVALIDCGNDKTADAIKAALASRGLKASDVTAIFLTHGHPDHTAGCKQFPKAAVYAMAEETALIGDAAEVTQPLHDGTVTTVGNLSVEAFWVPGHTTGSAMYLAKGVLFFGDTAVAWKNHEIMPAFSLFAKDPEQNLASLRKLETRLLPRAAEVKRLSFAHSGPLDGFEPFAAFAAGQR
jgi:glyoxylase-like metal-dependent hydrolase (beta-lactamase superfamily II)